jgi:uncharacterized protein YjdB/formylglycine-generating enzyme required for sulfatase activity
MKTWKLLLIVAIMFVVFTGCDNGNDPTPKDVLVTGVTLAGDAEFGLLVDEERILTYTVLPANATNKKVSWHSSYPSVATVSNTGIITAAAIGRATITVITDDGRYMASCTVTVGIIAVESVTLDKPLLNLKVGESQLLTPMVLPENAANRSVRWETSDYSKATVTNGMVTGVAEGTATITVRTNNNLSASCTVNVSPVAVTGVELDLPELNLDLWDSQRLTPTVLPANATNKRVNWSSSDPAVATVSTNGTVTGVSAGEAIITVTTADGGKEETCTVTVSLFVVSTIPTVWIEPGTFAMGSPENEPGRDDDETQHQVTLTKGFHMGEYPVTQAQYRAVMKTNPSYFNIEGSANEGYLDEWPVDGVTWYDALEFCNRQSTLEGLTPVYTITNKTPATGFPVISATVAVDWDASGYRLPTEAEWEYACRAGTTTIFNFQEHEWEFIGVREHYVDDELVEVDVYAPVEPTGEWGSDYIWLDWANFDGGESYNGQPTSEEQAWWGQTVPWRFYEDYPNAWGLYNMHGNIGEWCWDWLGDYPSTPQTDPKGVNFGSLRIMRGGSWFDYAPYVRSAYREAMGPGFTFTQAPPDSSGIPWAGFRVVRFGESSGSSSRAAPLIDERSGTAGQEARIVPQRLDNSSASSLKFESLRRNIGK